jgi:threonine/homoserine/homoserine lactone efflux protein
MFDSHFFAFAGVAALLVLSPGATMVVVADAAIEGGRRAALWTVAGIGTANGTMALAAAFGLAAVVQHVPGVLRAMSMVGAAYLAWLGLRALWRAVRGESTGPRPCATAEGDLPQDFRVGDQACVAQDSGRANQRHVAQDFSPARLASPLARFGRGLLTNYANPSVVIFYAIVVPQFITAQDLFLPRYLLLGGTHVAMSVVWQGTVGVSVGTFAERMTQPGVRRTMDLLTGLALLAFAVKLLFA